jgi:nucleotide-binding universal stress UspA family protein
MKEQFVILVGYDGSSCADAALEDLGRAGLPRKAVTWILSVNEVWLPVPAVGTQGSAFHFSTTAPFVANPKTSRYLPPAAAAAAPISEAQALVLNAKARLQSRFPVWEIKTQESSGSPARMILKKADELKPDLIVVGSQGRSALGRFLLGSVSQKVVNEAHCSVRVSRGTAWKNGSPVRIVIGLDGSAGSELAVKAVAERAWPLASAVRLIAVSDATQSAMDLVLPVKSKANVRGRTQRAWIESFMKAAQERLAPTQLSISTRIEEGDPKCVLISDAEEWGADCIFVGASGSNNLVERHLLGTVATAIVTRAHCSVEVVRKGYQ